MEAMRKARVNGIQMAYVDQGSGPAVLLVHGFPFTHAMWREQIDALAPRYRVLAPDLRGHGQSDSPPGPYPMELLADDLAGLLEHLGLEQVVLGGLSMGGYVTLAFWRRHQQRLRALILADTRARADTPEERQGRETTARLAETEGAAAVAERMLPRVLAPATLANRPDLVAYVRKMMLQVSPVGMAGALRGMAMRPDATGDLEKIACPTLVLVGQEDAITPPGEARAMAERLPRGELVVIPDAGHLAPLEQPAPTNQALREFLSAE